MAKSVMLAVAIGLSVSGYLGVHALLGSEELDLVWGMVRKKLAVSSAGRRWHVSRNDLQDALGLDGGRRIGKGIAAIVLPQASKAAVAAGLRAQWPAFEEASSSRLRAARQQLLEYLDGTRMSFALLLDFSQGTHFQRRVWNTLRAIPYGRLWSYRGLASRVGGVQYARAVGGAVGANPLPIVVPCHRIVAQKASIGGFSCGLPAKRKLLALEGSLSRLRRTEQD